jgi:hypothetical protein
VGIAQEEVGGIDENRAVRIVRFNFKARQHRRRKRRRTASCSGASVAEERNISLGSISRTFGPVRSKCTIRPAEVCPRSSPRSFEPVPHGNE